MKIRQRFWLLILLWALFLLACEQVSYLILEREDLFDLKLGFLEDQLNLFSNTGRERLSYNNIFFANGVFYIANGNSQKLIALSSVGDLLFMLYNPSLNPSPLLLKLSQTEDMSTLSTRHAVATPFQNLGPFALDHAKNIYIADISNQQSSNQGLGQPFWIIKQFDRLGNYLGYLGQDGRNGKPFEAYIENIFFTDNDELVVICLSNKGRRVFWFNHLFIPLFEIEFDNGLLPPAKEGSAIPSLQAIFPDYSQRLLYCYISYYLPIRDPATRLIHSIIPHSSQIYTFSLESQRYLLGSITVPADEGLTSDLVFSKDRQTISLPYNLLGVSAAKGFYLIKRKDQGLYEMLILGSNGKPLKRLRISLGDLSLESCFFNISREGLLYALLVEHDQARVCRWRTDKIN